MKFNAIAYILLSSLVVGNYAKGKDKEINPNSDISVVNENKTKSTKLSIKGAKMKDESEITELSREDVIKDMQFIAEKVKEYHISAVNGLPKDFDDQMKIEVNSLTEKVNIIEEFRILCRLMSSLHDSHSRLTDFYDPSGKLEKYFKKVIPRRLNDWHKARNGSAEFGPKIIHRKKKCNVAGVTNWNGVPYKELYHKFKECFPHENDEWCRANFELGDGQYDAPRLALAGVDITKPLNIELRLLESERLEEVRKNSEENFKRTGKRLANMINPFSSITKKVKLKNRSKINKSEWVSYDVDKDKNVGVFTLNECNYDKEYRDKVDKFFEEVFENNIDNIVIDLRKNSGGNSQVMLPFLYNLDIKSDIKLPKVERREGNQIIEIPPITVSAKEIKSRSGKKKFYDGKVFILTSNKTFSSALMWAWMFKDNNLAQIVGDIPGGAPTSFGDIKEFQTPSGLKFTVTYKKFYRDYGEADQTYDQDKLIPDIKIDAKYALDSVYEIINARR